jgi:hypothetical protein
VDHFRRFRAGFDLPGTTSWQCLVLITESDHEFSG